MTFGKTPVVKIEQDKMLMDYIFFEFYFTISILEKFSFHSVTHTYMYGHTFINFLNPL